MILVVAGTQFPFDRLIAAMDRAVELGRVREPVIAQIGRTSYRPGHLQAVDFLARREFRAHLEDCSAVVSHAGVGTILEALALEKPVLVLPRRAAEGEHVNDHQVGTAQRLASSGRILVARDAEHLIELIPTLSSFRPRLPAAAGSPLVVRVRRFLQEAVSSGFPPGSRL